MSEPSPIPEPLHLSHARLKRLLEESASMQQKGHGRLLAEALSALERTQDPIHVLRHLLALPKNGYAQRPQEQAALNDVGRWLELRLKQEPGLSAALLAQELGWLRRLGRYHEAVGNSEKRPAGPTGPSAGGRPHGFHKDGGASKVEVSFGQDLVDLERRRKALLSKKV